MAERATVRIQARVDPQNCINIALLMLNLIRGAPPHLSLNFPPLQFVVAGGSASRMGSFAELIAREINHPKITKGELDISKTDRFAFYKIGPVLSISVSL